MQIAARAGQNALQGLWRGVRQRPAKRCRPASRIRHPPCARCRNRAALRDHSVRSRYWLATSRCAIPSAVPSGRLSSGALSAAGADTKGGVGGAAASEAAPAAAPSEAGACGGSVAMTAPPMPFRSRCSARAGGHHAVSAAPISTSKRVPSSFFRRCTREPGGSTAGQAVVSSSNASLPISSVSSPDCTSRTLDFLPGGPARKRTSVFFASFMRLPSLSANTAEALADVRRPSPTRNRSPIAATAHVPWAADRSRSTAARFSLSSADTSPSRWCALAPCRKAIGEHCAPITEAGAEHEFSIRIDEWIGRDAGRFRSRHPFLAYRGRLEDSQSAFLVRVPPRGAKRVARKEHAGAAGTLPHEIRRRIR